MRRCALICLWIAELVLGGFHKDAPTLGSKNSPRRLSQVRGEYNYPAVQNHSVLFYREASGEMYVGATDFVLQLDVKNLQFKEKFPLKATGQQQCGEGPCENVITVIEEFQDSLFVCGTNGHNPQCWKLFPSVHNQSHETMKSYEGMGISPFVYTQNSLSLTVEGDLYAAAPLDADGSSLQFRRKAGSRTNVWMHDSWVSEPTFVSASWVKRQQDPENDKIYVFFREKNSDHSPEADPWISRVARICKVDEGGSKRFFQNMWTSFLKARLVCGFPDESLYFNHLQDVYVKPADAWQETRVYGLFSSSWNSTAVCIYSIGMIENIFENSTFKGFNQEVPNPRPGTCVRNSKELPLATVNMVKDHPEMNDWVHSLHRATPFYTSSNNYTKLTVDQVRSADQQLYNVLLLATDSGKVHKVLEAGSEPFIISETQLSSSSSLQSMKLDSRKKMLVVGFSEKISFVDLQRCQEYNNSCAECVLARDPYCAWTDTGCSPTVPGAIQDVKNGNISVCPPTKADQRQAKRRRRDADSEPEDVSTVHSVPLGNSFYLSCPIDSYHATYTWEHDGHTRPCLQMQSDCLHLIPAMTQDNYGTYRCVSKEKDFTQVLRTYELKAQEPPEVFRRNVAPAERNHASAVAAQMGWLLYGLTAAALGVFR
ncbi:semaphorin-7A [Betta splendens]|uniref:Semaphorin-7A n=1 Tax=Betta splendens TaxID=158456 RepID=A0A6P7MNL1_BETSP|nr:semaphorin-7A [Betta splendens]